MADKTSLNKSFKDLKGKISAKLITEYLNMNSLKNKLGLLAPQIKGKK